jgi:YidC/Oxa1 family membrane protein insertase
MAEIFKLVLYQPILNLLVFLYNIIPGHDLGIAIIILTIILKLILLPLSKKSLKSQKSLQDLQPKIDEIKKTYADKKEEQAKAMMNLYKENKVNPFSSCLPLLIQLPFLIAVFRVFRDGLSSGSLDLVYPFISRPETVNTISLGFINLSVKSIPLAILAGLAQYWQSKMMITKRPQQNLAGAKDEDMMAIMNKQMLYMMPILTVFISMSFPAGLSLYWFVTTVLTGLQQLYLFRKQDGEQQFIDAKIIK